MTATVYLETSIISYLAARPSTDLVALARQRLTRQWWRKRRDAFRIVIAPPVLAEAAAGDPSAAAVRLALLEGVPLLRVTDEAVALARSIERSARLPPRAAADALHVAITAVHEVDFLLTWNMRHIANAELRPAIESACRMHGLAPPVLTSPDALMGG